MIANPAYYPFLALPADLTLFLALALVLVLTLVLVPEIVFFVPLVWGLVQCQERPEVPSWVPKDPPCSR